MVCKSQYYSLLLTDITYADLLTAQPFSDTVDVIELQGKHLREALEFSVSRVYGLYRGNGRHKRDVEATEFNGHGFLQMSGKSCSVLIPSKNTDRFKITNNRFRFWTFLVVTPCRISYVMRNILLPSSWSSESGSLQSRRSGNIFLRRAGNHVQECVVS
jgi:hypothetical protein